MGVRELLQRRAAVTTVTSVTQGVVTEKSLANQGYDHCDHCDHAKHHGGNHDAANDGLEWSPTDVAEAAEERAAIVEEATGVSAEDVARAANRFYAHVFGPGLETGCCRAAFDRYCDEGARLKREYDAAVAACDASLPELNAARARVNQGEA